MPTESPAKRAPRKRVAALDDKRSAQGRAAVARRRTPAAARDAQQQSMPTSPLVVDDLAITAVRPDPKNVRKHIGDITELTESIRQHGVLEPLNVTKSGKGYMIVCGERRYRAAKAAGCSTVPCIIREYAPQARLEAQLTENLQRADLTPLEEARAYDRMLEFVPQRQLADRVNRSQSHISKRLTLLKLPAKLHEQLDSGELAVGDALELAKLAAMDDGPKLVDETLRVMRSEPWGELHDVIGEVVEKAGNRAKHDQAVAQLKADGVAVIAWPKGGWFGSKAKPIKTKTPASSRYRYSAEDLPFAAVKAGGHLAAAVAETGEVLYVCTEPAKYRKKEQPTPNRLSDKEKADRARRRDENKQRRQAADDRLPYLRKVVGEGWGNEFVGLHLIDAIGRTSLDALRIACDILEIELDGKTDWQLGQEAHDALYDRAVAQPTRVGMAIGLAITDHRLRRDSYFTADSILESDIVDAAAARLFYGYLGANGYEPATPWELELVSGIKGFTHKAS